MDTLGMVMGRLKSGAWVTLHGCGETIRTCASGVWVFCTEAILYTDVWGKWLRIQRQACDESGRVGSAEFEEVPVPASLGVWEQFLAVRGGRIPNPSPPEVGLRMARLWDAIQASAGQGGMPVEC